jgi:hypothetical protein
LLDTVRLFSFSGVDSYNLDRLAGKMENVNYGESKGISYVRGNIENLKVWASENGLSIEGSWQKFIHGNNVNTWNWRDTAICIEALADTVYHNLDHAIVTKLDLASTVKTKFSPVDYFGLLVDFPRRKRIAYLNTLYFGTQKQNSSMCFYDKGKEAQIQGNWLRYELRLKTKKTIQKYGVHDVRSLAKNSVQEHLSNLWASEYHKIVKISPDQVDHSHRIKPGAARSEFLQLHAPDYLAFLNKKLEQGGLSTHDYYRAKKFIGSDTVFNGEKRLSKLHELNSLIDQEPQKAIGLLQMAA